MHSGALESLTAGESKQAQDPSAVRARRLPHAAMPLFPEGLTSDYMHVEMVTYAFLRDDSSFRCTQLYPSQGRVASYLFGNAPGGM